MFFFFFFFFFLFVLIFLIDEGREDSNSTKNRPVKCHLKLSIRWRFDDGPTMDAGLVALRFSRDSRQVLQRNPIAL